MKITSYLLGVLTGVAAMFALGWVAQNKFLDATSPISLFLDDTLDDNDAPEAALCHLDAETDWDLDL